MSLPRGVIEGMSSRGRAWRGLREVLCSGFWSGYIRSGNWDC